MSWWSHSTHIRCWLHPGFVKAAKLDERVGYLIVQLWNALLRRSGVTSCLFRAAWGSLVLLISERAGLLQVLTLCPAHEARQIIELVLSAFGEPSTESPQPGSDGLVAPNHLRCLRHRCRSNIPFFPVIAENATWVEVAFQKCGSKSYGAPKSGHGHSLSFEAFCFYPFLFREVHRVTMQPVPIDMAF